MGKAGAVAVRERVRLNSAGVMRPFLGRLLRLESVRLSHMLATEPARWWRAKGEDGAPNPRASVRSTGRPTLAVFGEVWMYWIQGHEGSLGVGKMLYV